MDARDTSRGGVSSDFEVRQTQSRLRRWNQGGWSPPPHTNMLNQLRIAASWSRRGCPSSTASNGPGWIDIHTPRSLCRTLAHWQMVELTPNCSTTCYVKRPARCEKKIPPQRPCDPGLSNLSGSKLPSGRSIAASGVPARRHAHHGKRELPLRGVGPLRSRAITHRAGETCHRLSARAPYRVCSTSLSSKARTALDVSRTLAFRVCRRCRSLKSSPAMFKAARTARLCIEAGREVAWTSSIRSCTWRASVCTYPSSASLLTTYRWPAMCTTTERLATCPRWCVARLPTTPLSEVPWYEPASRVVNAEGPPLGRRTSNHVIDRSAGAAGCAHSRQKRAIRKLASASRWSRERFSKRTPIPFLSFQTTRPASLS